MPSLPGQLFPEQKTIQKETDEETFPGDETNCTEASQSESKSSGGCPDQSAPVSLASQSYSSMLGRGTESPRGLGKNGIKAHGEVPRRMYRTSLTPQDMESGTNCGYCFSSSPKDTREREMGNRPFIQVEC